MSFDDIQAQLPAYLSPQHQKDLLAGLKDFVGKPFYTLRHRDDLLQGDCCRGFVLFNYETGTREKVTGIILSNTCDIAPENIRDISPKVVFAPVIPLRAYELLLQRSGAVEGRIQAQLASIRAQRMTSIFYLPRGGELDEECIVLLDDVYSMPSSQFIESTERVKISTLSMLGFYLFTFKLSIHFCRLNDCMDRSA